VFPDVIDHSYQYIQDPAESMRRALSDNLGILTDLDLARQLRAQAMPRLLANRKRFLGRPFGDMLADIVEQQYPDRAKEIKRHFRIF